MTKEDTQHSTSQRQRKIVTLHKKRHMKQNKTKQNNEISR